MKILGIDSSGQTAGISLLEDGEIKGEFSLNTGLKHSETLLPLTDSLLKFLDVKVSQIDAIAVSNGPGSFTGLRIGACEAKGLSFPFGIPLIEVSTLEALYFNVKEAGEFVKVHPIMDARRGEVYTATFYKGEKLSPERAIPIEMLLGELKEDRQLFTGDAVAVYRDIIINTLKERAEFSQNINSLQRAASVANIGYQKYLKGEWIEGKDLRLRYLRKSQAERERDKGIIREYDIIHENINLEKEEAKNLLKPRQYEINMDSGYESSFIPKEIS